MPLDGFRFEFRDEGLECFSLLFFLGGGGGAGWSGFSESFSMFFPSFCGLGDALCWSLAFRKGTLKGMRGLFHRQQIQIVS